MTRDVIPEMPVGSLAPIRKGQPVYDGWIVSDGRTLKRSDYPELFYVLGHLYGGKGDEFNLPDFPEPASEVEYVIKSKP